MILCLYLRTLATLKANSARKLFCVQSEIDISANPGLIPLGVTLWIFLSSFTIVYIQEVYQNYLGISQVSIVPDSSI
jgi:hypothetical protein